MGSSQSNTRELVIDNPNETNILEISENVANRLHSDTSGQSSNNNISFESVYITSHQIKKEIDKEIEKNNSYWKNRLQKLQQEYNNIDKQFDEEYIKAIKEAEIFSVKMLAKTKEDLCLKNRQSIINCFSKNKLQPLLCSKEVEDFSQCVSSSVGLLSKT